MTPYSSDELLVLVTLHRLGAMTVGRLKGKLTAIEPVQLLATLDNLRSRQRADCTPAMKPFDENTIWELSVKGKRMVDYLNERKKGAA